MRPRHKYDCGGHTGKSYPEKGKENIMALDENNGGSPFTMPVQPFGGYGNNGLFGGGDGSWLILWLICMMCGGWGGFGMGGGMWPAMMMGGMGGFGGGWGIDYLYPWLNNSQHISDGFRDQNLQTSIAGLQNSVTSGFGDVQLGIAGINQNLCQTGNGIINAVNSGFNSAEVAANSRQMANMQQGFGLQTAMMQGFNAAQAQAADCCCKTQTGIADLRYTVATEACADRAAVGDALQAVTMQGYQNTNALLTAFKDGVQSIKDELCADRLDAERRDNANLRAELMYARGQASQVAQTAELRQSGANQLNQLVSELRSCPIPAQPVYGNTPIWTRAQNVANNNTCGCPGNNGFVG
jgi:hypothetical protein